MSNFPAYNYIGKSPYGRLIYNTNDVYIGRSVAEYHEYSDREVVVFNQLLQRGQVVVEAGANIGTHTLFFAQKVGATGRVLAFEPQRLLFQTLCGNMALNSVTSAHCWNMAVGAEVGEAAIPCPDPTSSGNFGGISLKEASQAGSDTELVPVITIDSLQLPSCHLIKVDVEGMEEDVLRGAAETIARCRPFLYVECDRPEKQDSLLQLIDSYGYAMHWHTPPLFNPENLAGNPENIFGEIVSRNLFCLDRSIDCQLTGFTPVDRPQAA